MNLTTRIAVCAVGALFLDGLAAALSAQTPATPPPKSDEEVVQLSEFSVSANADRGYVASETLTGTRVRTQIVDLPYTVNVLTSEFFSDFAMFELGDNLTQIGSFTGLDIGGGFTLRGFSSSSQLRDGFYRLGRYGSSNIDRMEIIKGSNAAIYGRTSPGGMVNFISKQPRDREHQQLSLSYGTYDQRAYLESTGPLLTSSLGKTSYIFTAANYQKDFEQDFSRFRNDEYYLAVRHTFRDQSTLMLSAEYFHQTRHAPPGQAPIITDMKGTATNTDDEVIGYATNLARYNPYGPNSELNRGNVSFTGVFDHRFSDVWSTHMGANYFRARRWDYNQNTGWGAITINNPAANASNYTTTRGTTPNKGLIMEDGGGVQADLLAHYWLANHTIENRTLFTIDFNDYYRWDPTWNYGPTTNPDIAAWSANGSGRVVQLDQNFRPIGPIAYFPKWFQWGNEVLSRLTRRRTTVLGGLLREQAAFFHGRLLAYAGARFDAVRFQERDYTTTVGSQSQAGTFRSFPGYANYNQGDMIRRTVTQLKPNVGVNYKVTPQLRAFANYSESYFVNQTDNPIVFADPAYKPEVASGYDYGLKGSFMQDKVNFTVSGFYATRENVSVSDTFESPPGSGQFVTQNRRDGNQLVRGFEIDFNWRPVEDLTFIGSWGHVYSIYTNFGSGKPLSVGRRVNGVAPENGSITMKYAPTKGALRGFSANVGWTYVASTPTENPDAGDVYNPTPVNGVLQLQRTTYQWRLRVPSFGLWNAGVRYTFRRARFDHTLALNVNNLADIDYLRLNRQMGEGRNVIFTYTLGFSGRH